MEATGGGVHHEADVLVLVIGRAVEHDPVVRAEAVVQGVAGVGGGGAPVVADGAEGYVAVEIGGGKEKAGDAVNEVEWEGGPA
jgi:hypothetical protein